MGIELIRKAGNGGKQTSTKQTSTGMTEEEKRHIALLEKQVDALTSENEMKDDLLQELILTIYSV